MAVSHPAMNGELPDWAGGGWSQSRLIRFEIDPAELRFGHPQERLSVGRPGQFPRAVIQHFASPGAVTADEPYLLAAFLFAILVRVFRSAIGDPFTIGRPGGTVAPAV